MKIKTQNDIELLALKINDDFDIDVNKYRNDDVTSTFAELLLFPQYIINWGIRPILVAIALFIVVFFVEKLDNVLEVAIYASIGFLLFIVCGVLFSIVFIMRKMKYDMGAIMGYSIEILKEATGDISDFNKNLTLTNKKEGIKLLYLGIIHIVTIPTVCGAVKRKNAFIGPPISWIIKKILTAVGNTVTVNDLESSIKTTYAEKDKSYQNEVLKSVTQDKNILEKIVDTTLSIIEFPFKFLFGIAFLLLVFFLYILY